MTRCVILASGSGAVVQTLIDSAYFGQIPEMELVAVISTKPDAYVLTRAKAGGVKTYVIDRDVFPNEQVFQRAIDDKLADLDTDLAVLSGFTGGLSAGRTRRFTGRAIIARPILSANTGVLASYEDTYSDAGAVTVCFADEKGAPGREVRRQTVPRLPDDTPETLARRLVDVGGAQLAEAVKSICRGELN